MLVLALAGTMVGCGSSSATHPEPDGSVPTDDTDSGTSAMDDGGTRPNPDGGPELPTETEFFSSFEGLDPAVTWNDTVETTTAGGDKALGVTERQDRILGALPLSAVTGVSASGEHEPAEIAEAVVDGNESSKWLVFADTGWLQVELDHPVIIRRYALTSANDSSGRDPKDWKLEGSSDGANWVTLDLQFDQDFTSRFQTKIYNFNNSTAYSIYRLSIVANHDAGEIQLAELQLSDGADTPENVGPMTTRSMGGPSSGWNAKIGAGFTGLHALRYAGSQISTSRSYSFNRIYDVDLYVTETSQLSYVIFPDENANNPAYPATYVAVDLAFTDGTYLSELGAVDQYGGDADPLGQGRARVLYSGEWNDRVVDLGAVAAGKVIDRILVGYDNDNPTQTDFGGFIDDVRITATPPETPAHLADYVITTRGTNASNAYSRGNNIPATAVPHGFNFWIPATNAETTGWIYSYQRDNDDANRPRLESLNLSHQPSPWMGDRQTFQVMPSIAAGTPDASPDTRAMTFAHANEIARPHYYSVRFDNGVRAEITPTDHAAMFRFTFPGDDASVILDDVFDDDTGITLDAGNASFSAYTDVRSGLSAGASRMFIYGEFDHPVTASGGLTGGASDAASYFRFDVSSGRVVTLRIATSLISVAQAQRNLAEEIADDDTFDDVMARARDLWDAKLGVVEVEGATREQRTTLYSNLYRLFLYPNSIFEHTGQGSKGGYQYASPVRGAAGASTPTQTGASIVDGKMYVNNGFWDTFRAVWPAYALLAPDDAAELIDGFVQMYRDGGWIARWSSPGYADLMTGTSSDVAFADAFLRGVDGFDVESAYDAAVRDATVWSSSGGVGRKGLRTSIFQGFTDTSTGQGFSWGMAGFLNDFGIANLAEALAEDTGHPRHQEFVESAAYFRARAQSYANYFRADHDFFEPKNADGSWEYTTEEFDPTHWLDGYTETNPWNMAFDATWDGEGLATLYGGRDALGEKLDEFFSTPAYLPQDNPIHEMREARDVRLGQLGLSNQPAYHIIHMYYFAQRPADAQRLVRDALTRLWVGSAIGQGYLGDEDNGSSSAWYVLNALGLFPGQIGSPIYFLGAPLFTKVTIHRPDGDVVLRAPDAGRENLYVQSVSVNGGAHSQSFIAHDDLVGATLDFVLGPTPSAWGTGASDVPPSVSPVGEAPAPLRDRASEGAASTNDATATLARLTDDDSMTSAAFAGADPRVDFAFGAAEEVTFYTLTSGADRGAVPAGWVLRGSNDGTHWTDLDSRSGITYDWSRQTRPFEVPSAAVGAYTHYRLDFAGAPAGAEIAEIELLH
jgi:predicted alpha-1,2-mannosidase